MVKVKLYRFSAQTVFLSTQNTHINSVLFPFFFFFILVSDFCYIKKSLLYVSVRLPLPLCLIVKTKLKNG